jgi:hypothetical protein
LAMPATKKVPAIISLTTRATTGIVPNISNHANRYAL